MNDAEQQKQVDLLLRPLIAIECSVIDDCYMGLGIAQEDKEEFPKLKVRCHRVRE